jgi:hypothetical protein
MYGYYTPILVLQAFCLYHAYKNNIEQRWYWLILFFPGVGCLMYLYHNFYNRRSINNISEGIKVLVNTNYKIEQLERAYKFSDNLKNRLDLADEYMKVKRYSEAVELYRLSLTGFMADDAALKSKLLQALFLNEDYTAAIEIGNQLKNHQSFNNSDERISYAWSFHYQGEDQQAEEVFSDMDKPYRNFKARIEYSKFLREIKKVEESKNVLNEMLEEFDMMKPHERKINRENKNEVISLLSYLQRNPQKVQS